MDTESRYRNPITGRLIKEGSAVYNRLKQAGHKMEKVITESPKEAGPEVFTNLTMFDMLETSEEVNAPLTAEDLNLGRARGLDPLRDKDWDSDEHRIAFENAIQSRLKLGMDSINIGSQRAIIESQKNNKKIIAILEKLKEHFDLQKIVTNDVKFDHKSHQTISAINALKEYSGIITSGRDLAEGEHKLKGIGEGFGRRIDEILTTGGLAELHTVEGNPEIVLKTNALTDLTKVHGIGPKRALKLYDEEHIHSLIELIQRQSELKLNHDVTLGIKYLEDSQHRIPFREISHAHNKIQHVIHSIYPTMQAMICGSHRRLTATSGDIDVLLIDPTIKTKAELNSSTHLKRLVDGLTQSGFLIDHLTMLSTSVGRNLDHATKYMGYCRIVKGGYARRIDIRLVPVNSFPAALLYFSGGGEFNQIMRGIAKKRGFTINEYGVYRLIGGVAGNEIVVRNERDIFDLVGITYLDPEKREF